MIWHLCGQAFSNYVYVNLDLIGQERSEKVMFVELRDVSPIEAESLARPWASTGIDVDAS